MRLFLLRHGIAEPGTSRLRDFDRALTVEGRDELELIARALRRLKVAPELTLTSPLVRARETAAAVAPLLESRVEVAEELSGGATFERFLDLVRRHAAADALMLVGHETDFSTAAARWIGADEGAIVLKKAGLIRIDLHGGLGSGRLRWLLTPHQLKLIGQTVDTATDPDAPSPGHEGGEA